MSTHLFDLPQNTSTPIPPEGSKKEVISRQGCGEIKKVLPGLVPDKEGVARDDNRKWQKCASPRLQQKNMAVDEYSPFAVVLST